MNKITKRIVAGASAAALLVSAVGIDQLADLFMTTSYADSTSTRNGRSTGFSNLEQDTTTGNDKYNTGYGLHTNKTATAVDDDGRTFDVDLESWYVGENPVDVATILDASGSMAWTVDTLEPLSTEEITKVSGMTLEQLRAEQEANGGYLKQETVDKILKPENTDNSKLSYNKYHYYVYEDRPSVSEFVPLGYWDGSTQDPTVNKSLIGYYPFENSLENKVGGGKASYIQHAADTGNKFDTSNKLTTKVEPAYMTSDENTLDLAETIRNGGLLADVKASSSFTVAMRVRPTEIASNGRNNKTPLVCIGSNGNYISLYRHSSDPRRLKVAVFSNGKLHDEVINIGSFFHDEAANKKGWVNILLSYDDNTKKISVDLSIKNADSSNQGTHFDCDASSYNFNFTDEDIIIGGDVINNNLSNKYTDMQLTDFCIFNKALDNSDIYTLNDKSADSSTGNNLANIKHPKDLFKDGSLVAYYDFGDNDKDNKLGNRVDASGSLKLIKQAEDGAFSGEELDKIELAPTYTTDAASGEHSLNVTQTSKLGSVLLDAAPENDGDFTISFAIKHANKDYQEKNGVAEIMYLGNLDLSKNDYYHIARNWQLKDKSDGSINDDRHLRFFDKDKNGASDAAHVKKAFDTTDWCTATFVVDDGMVYAYKNGKPDEEKYSGTVTQLDTSDINIIIAGLKEEYSGSDIYIDDLYVFDDALTVGQVDLYFGKELCDATTYKEDNKTGKTVPDKALYHAKNADGTEFAQISDSLYNNSKDDDRVGWYYVNSQSNWTDVTSCLQGGKQYLGIIEDTYLGTTKVMKKSSDSDTLVEIPDEEKESKNDRVKAGERDKVKETDNQSLATVPSLWQAAHDAYEEEKKNDEGAKPPEGQEDYLNYYNALKAGNDETKKFEYTGNERSIRFYVDSQGYLRCFVNSGKTSWSSSSKVWSYEVRTFCSLVYTKEPYNTADKSGQATKYEQLNEALNQFYAALAEHSDLTNSAIVRFSTNNAADNLDQLIMKGWTNWSEYYTNAEGKKPEKNTFMNNLLIPEIGETSTNTTTSTAQKIEEYPYVMTGGTYTWTGLKAFYDNMVKTKGRKDDGTDLSSGDRVYDIANDARDKYLIIFTDGRDNTQDLGTADDGKVYNTMADEKYSPDGKTSKKNGELAEAWADKLKDEGYTIYCVMMATGSISPTANADEYERAHTFLTTLAGNTETDKELEELEQQLKDAKDKVDAGEYIDEKLIASLEEQIENIKSANVIVADPTKENATVDAFQNILNQIQQPRADYTVQDYIDPRFDLVDKDGNLYKLGAGGKITVTDKDGNAVTGLTLSDGSTFTNGNAVGNIIDNINDTTVKGLAYTPRKSEMVNRKATSGGYDNGDGVGTGYIYYDDEKDMYYLRWEDQVIPMEDEAFDTGEGKPIKYLDVWSATIRLKAKDDFIGGNNILTNGNEAGENLVYSDATIENMDKNPNLYFTDDELNEYTDTAGKIDIPYREKLKVLSGTDRKINAVDAGGVSQAVYGDGIDIPSSGFPRTTVNVRLLKLDAKNLNDVIYMGEVVSPTMMLADLEDGYMTGSYYLEYLERYAYRLYGYDAAKTPLLELLNQWLKINDKDATEKTFTIPYIYLPDPVYDGDKLKVEDNKVVVNNNTGMSPTTVDGYTIADFSDLNLRDVTGFITYTWKREDKDVDGDGEVDKESQQAIEGQPDKYDITKDYVVKNTNQIKYNLQLKFTPLKETADELNDFTLDENFINADTVTHTGGDKFFNIGDDGEFAEMTTGGAWTTEYGREDYLKAMIQEARTYEPHVMYDGSTNKWVLVNDDSADFSSDEAVKAYVNNDDTEQTKDAGDRKVTDSGVYDWDNDYKPEAGDEQIESGKSDNYYTNTPDNVVVSTDGFSLVANTTYTKDVVNAALALELVVDGKYLKGPNPEIKAGKEYKFIAKRQYNDPLDPLPYGGDVYADVYSNPTGHNGYGRGYRLTFTVDTDSIPENPQDNQPYTVWAKLTNVEVEECETGGVHTYRYKTISESATPENPYLGYEKPDALPIGTYTIKTALNSLENDQFKIADRSVTDTGEDLYFQYLNADSDTKSYKHGRFPGSVYEESDTAVTSTGDGDYLIWNDSKDNSSKNIAESKSERQGFIGMLDQTVTFYFGTVEGDSGDKGVSVKDYLKEHPEVTSAADFTDDYAKDRLGIIMLSVDPNSLTITKEVTNTNTSTDTYKNKDWNFTVTIKTSDDMWLMGKGLSPGGTGGTLNYTLYERDTSGEWNSGTEKTVGVTCSLGSPSTLTFNLQLKHNQKAVFRDLPSGTWQVTEETMSGVLYTPHNNQSGFGEDEWRYQNSAATNVNTLNPISQVDFENEFPYELPSAGGSGTVRYILLGTLLTAVGVILFVVLYYDRRKRTHK